MPTSVEIPVISLECVFNAELIRQMIISETRIDSLIVYVNRAFMTRFGLNAFIYGDGRCAIVVIPAVHSMHFNNSVAEIGLCMRIMRLRLCTIEYRFEIIT